MRDQTVDLAITGMTCAACVGRVEKVLARVPGVAAVSVNLATERARVCVKSPLDIAVLTRVVEKAGYGAVAVRAEDPPAKQTVVEPLWHWVLAAVFSLPLMAGMLTLVPMPPAWAQFMLAAPVQFGLGARFYRAGWNAVRAGSGNMDLLVAIGTSAAFGQSVWNWLFTDHAHELYFETSVVLITFILFGKWLERRARERAGDAIRALSRLRPETARRLHDGREIETSIDAIVVGDRIASRPGERLPVDGRVISGLAAIDAASLSGESTPVTVAPGSAVAAGTINIDGHLVIEATAVGAETTLARVVRLVEGAQASKAPAQRVADRVSAVFVPVILGLAALTWIGWVLMDEGPQTALAHAVAVLVIACPCALGLATPIAIIAGTGRAARLGVLIRDAEALERARQIGVVVFDKTGTLTEGKPGMTAINAADPTEALRLAAGLQAGSEHGLAAAIRAHAEREGVAGADVEGFRALPGRGVTGTIAGVRYAMGNARLMDELGVRRDPIEPEGRTLSWLAALAPVPRVLGVFAFTDMLKPGSSEAVAALRGMGLRISLLTGDNEAAARVVGGALGIEDIQAEVAPADKAARIGALRADGSVVAMVGDGINDAPALAGADIGIAMSNGTDVAMETAGITLMRGDPRLVATAIALSRQTTTKIHQGLFWAFAYNLLGVPLAALGYLSPILAAAAMALSSVSVVANALIWPRSDGFSDSRRAGGPG